MADIVRHRTITWMHFRNRLGRECSRVWGLGDRTSEACGSPKSTMNTPFEWTPEITASLIALWEEGLPTAEIGQRLGVTKNAVIGKVHRLGLAKRQSPIKGGPPRGKRKKPVAEVIRLDSLKPGMCSWPEGDPGTEEFRFCGEKAVVGKPYCEGHCAKAYVKPSKEKKSAVA